MVGDAGRLVAERQERRYQAFTAEPVAEEFGGQQELGEEAEACEANAGRRGSDAQALQSDATGCVQAAHCLKLSIHHLLSDDSPPVFRIRKSRCVQAFHLRSHTLNKCDCLVFAH